MRKIYLAFILVMISLIANSQVKDWNDPTTWNGNVPSSNNSVTINSGDSIKLTSDVKIRNLTVQSMAYLDLICRNQKENKKQRRKIIFN